MDIATFIIFCFSYLIVRGIKVEINFTNHQTGKIYPQDLYNVIVGTVLLVWTVHEKFFLIPFIAYCITFSQIHDLIWTIVGRRGLREQSGRGEIMGQLIHYAFMFIIYGLTIDIVSFHKLLNYFFVVFPHTYALYIFITKNGHLSK